MDTTIIVEYQHLFQLRIAIFTHWQHSLQRTITIYTEYIDTDDIITETVHDISGQEKDW